MKTFSLIVLSKYIIFEGQLMSFKEKNAYEFFYNIPIPLLDPRL